MRTFPSESVMGRLQVLSAVHVTLDPLAAPVSSTKDCAAALALFVALFQFVFATTPALSEAAIAVPLPTKLMLTARGVVVTAVKLAVWFEVIFVNVLLGGVNV